MSEPPEKEKAPEVRSQGSAFKNQNDDAGERERENRSSQSSRVVNRWARLHEANACYDRWLQSGKTDLSAASQGAAAYDDFFRTSQQPADIAFVKFYDACLTPTGSSDLDRKTMMNDVLSLFSATFASMASVCTAVPRKERAK